MVCTIPCVSDKDVYTLAFGSCVAKLGDISGNFHFAKFALSLLDKVGSWEKAGEVICVGAEVRAYVEPLQAANEYHTNGYAAAKATGDATFATMYQQIYLSPQLFLCWLKLQAKCNERKIW